MENKKPNPIKIDRLRPTLFAASGFVLLAAIGLWISAVIISMIPIGSAMDSIFTMDMVYYLPFLILPMGIYMLRHRGLSEGLRLNPMPFFPMITVILLAVISVFICSILSNLWVMLLEALGLEYVDTSIIPAGKNELMLSIITMAAIPAICEELLMRGFVFSAWETRGTRYAIWVSTILFALLHGNIYGLPAYIYTGLITGYLVFALDTLYAGIIYHTVYNAACLVVSYIAMMDTAALEQSQQMLETMSTGALVMSMLSELLMFGLMAAISLGSLRLRRKILGIQPFLRMHEPLKTRERIMLALSLIPMIAMLLLNI